MTYILDHVSRIWFIYLHIYDQLCYMTLLYFALPGWYLPTNKNDIRHDRSRTFEVL